MSRQWKEAERQIARRVGGVRISNHALGLRTPDVESSWLSLEVKHRTRLPVLITDTMAQARRNATPGKLVAAVLHEEGQRYDDAVIMIRLGDWVEWFGGLTPAEEA
jgi:hypothetical protein